MTKEQVIEQLKSLKADRESFIQNDKEHDKVFLDDIEAIETVLSMLEQQDRVIDLMSEQLTGLAIFDIDRDQTLILGDKEEVEQYFENKAKEVE